MRLWLIFAKFERKIIQSLENVKVPLEQFKVFILSLKAFTDGKEAKVLDQESIQEIKAAKNISEVFIALHKYISFFNYHIVKHIIDEFGEERDYILLQKYLEKFHRFCHRNIYEVPSNLFPPISRFTAKVFALKCTEGVSTLENVETYYRRYCQNFLFASSSFATLFNQERLC